MKSKGFTLIELIIAILILASAYGIISTFFLASIAQRKKTEVSNAELYMCKELLDCLKYLGTGRIKNIYDLSPRSSGGEASWCIYFDSHEEIRPIIEKLYVFPGYEVFSDIPDASSEGRYAACIAISVRKNALRNIMEYPVKLMLKDLNDEGGVWLRMDYEFTSEI